MYFCEVNQYKGIHSSLKKLSNQCNNLMCEEKKKYFLSYNEERLKNFQLQGHTLEAYLKTLHYCTTLWHIGDL